MLVSWTEQESLELLGPQKVLFLFFCCKKVLFLFFVVKKVLFLLFAVKRFVCHYKRFFVFFGCSDLLHTH